MTKEQYWKEQYKKTVGYWFDKEIPNMGRIEMILTAETRAEEQCREECKHRFAKTTKNYKPAKKCVECGFVVLKERGTRKCSEKVVGILNKN